jgi:hypothetical protein
MAVAANLTRPSFAHQVNNWVNIKLTNMTGVAVAGTLTVTVPALYGSYQLIGIVNKLLPFNSVQLNITSVTKPSGIQLLPEGSAVTG